MSLLLVLDDDRTRLRGFDEIAPRLGDDWTLRTWRDAPSMLADIDRMLDDARLISLDHDLYRDSPIDPDPGTGRVIADFLSRRTPVCPVVVHSTNTDAAWGMFNTLVSAGWKVELVHHLNEPDWIEDRWLPVARRLMQAADAAADRPRVPRRVSAKDTAVALRRATSEDAPAVAACVCAAYLHYIERIGKQPGPMLEDYAEVIARKQVHVAVGEGAIVGAIVLEAVAEGFYLDNVAVHPRARGTGVGKLLLQLAEDEARRQGYESIFLATHEKMIENRDLYRRIGYVEYDRRIVNGYPRVFFRKSV